MHRLLLPLILLSQMSSADCPNLSGTFVWSDEDGNRIAVEVTQGDCEQVVMRYNAFGFPIKNVHLLNGEKRLVEDNGDFQAYETATWMDGHLQIMEERVGVDDEDGSNYRYFVEINIFLNSDGHLVDIREFKREDGVSYRRSKTTYIRQ